MMADPMNPIDHSDPLLYMNVRINDLHYGYLYAHESLQKLEEKERLEGQIQEFLMVAPHEKKFCYHETIRILHRSAEFKENFTGISASAAWTSIAAYAHNLLAQSWRREYREIKTYSGFYKHNIENGLVEPDIMLTLMGYRKTGECIFTLDGPVDPDKVANVSRDSLVALVECKILCTLYAELLRSGCQYKYLDILEYRETHPCTIEQALNGLIYQWTSQSWLGYYPHCNLMDRSALHYRPHLLPTYYDTTDGIPMVGPCHFGNKYTTCHKDYSIVPSMRPNNSCPTGQLIELDSPYHSRDNYSFDTDNQKLSVSSKLEPHASSFTANNDNSNFVKSKFGSDAGWESWGATYLPPDSRTNLKYDSLLVPPKHKAKELEESLKNLKFDDPQPSCSSAEPKTYDKASDKNSKKKPKNDSNNAVQSSSQTLGRDLSKKPDLNYRSLKVKLSEKWECPTCTFHNTNDKDVCEMCSKSKMLGNEVQPLVSGGRQCPKCTLVNEKGATVCKLCDTDLKDSPTYI